MWLRRNIDEIRDDPVLRAYGACLALTHVLSFLFWRWSSVLPDLLRPGAEAICWPFWEDCFRYRILSAAQWDLLLWIYLGWSLLSLGLFARKSWATAAWVVFAALNLFKLIVVVQDFQLRQNQHTMAGLACVAFLLVPGKRRLLPLLLVSFYFWAGLLKLNHEWLSGEALYAPLWFFAGAWLPVVCTYVVVLEIVLVWGLLSPRPWLFWATLAQLLLFHVMSWPVVGFFYPTLMFALLAILPLDRMLPRPSPETGRNPPPALGRPALGFLALFSAAQLFSRAMPGDSALTGEGRLFSVHMFDALVRCEGYALLKNADGSTDIEDLYRPLSFRIGCDPLVFLNRAQALCRLLEATPAGPRDFDLRVKVRRGSQGELRTIVYVTDFCAARPTYSIWHHNEWIRPLS